MNRHPPRKKQQSSTDAHTTVSYGTREWKLLQYLLIKRGERFNKCMAARDLKIPRSSVYEILYRLENKGCVKIPYKYHAVITKKGINVLNAFGKGVDISRRGCREGGVGRLSQHYSKFTMQITGKKDYRVEKLQEKGWYYEGIKKMNNWQYDLFRMDEDTVAINPNKIVIRIHDLIDKDTDETMFQAVLKAKQLIEQLKDVGITGKGFSYDGAHYARIDSYLSQFLKKIDDKYFLRLKDGSAFWIDNSHGLEDETDSIEVRNNIDHNMQQLLTEQFDFDDIKQMKSIVKEHTKQIYMLYNMQKPVAAFFQQPNGIDRSKPPTYIY
jgi:hypothetical protein